MVPRLIVRQLALFGALVILSGNGLAPPAVRAETPLNRAVIESLRNAVKLILQNQSPRPARVRDTMTPGDALATARAALAELRFNDGSLARVGGQALFRFLPNTRTFQLSNGTLLLLVPPGRGQTRIQTPNAATGIRGSALFVRYLPDTDVTLIGALTESGIEVSNRDRSQNQPLRAGQLAVVVKDRIERVYQFDLNTFYETSDLVKGLELQHPLSPQSQLGADPAIAAVRTETAAAVKAQTSLNAANNAPAESIQNVSTAPRAAATATLRDAIRNPDDSRSTTASQESSLSREVAAPLATKLLEPPSATVPTAIPPTIALPTLPGTDLAATKNPIPTDVLPPGAAAGVDRGNGPSGAGAPGLNGTAPGLAGTTPGQNRNLPPGLAGTAPGLAGTTPGQSGSAPPGLAGTAPGLAGTTPGGG